MAVLATPLSAVVALASTDFASNESTRYCRRQLAWHSDLTSSPGAEYLAAGLVIFVAVVAMSVVARVLRKIFKGHRS